LIGGERLRDKNDKDYLETIRENERMMVLNGKASKKSLNSSGNDDH
jgi:hypothetical protein